MKRLFSYGLVLCVLGFTGWLGVKVYRGNAEKDAIRAKILNLPDFGFYDLQGKAITASSLPPQKAVVILHFLTDCHFCQGEVREIVRHAGLFRDAHVVLVSMQDAATLRQFRREYGLDSLGFVSVVSDTARGFAQTFGTMNVPTTLVYSQNRVLLRQFTGETSAAAIAKIIDGSAALSAR